MKIFNLYLILPILVFSAHGLTDIKQAPTMAEALKDADHETMVFFDLDNTVFMPPQSLGGEEWFDYFVEKRSKEFKALGMNEKDAIEKAVKMGVADFTRLHQNGTPVIPVDEDTPKLINDLQAKGISTVALTARNLELLSGTRKELEQIHVFFERTAPKKSPLKLKLKNPALYSQGMIFVGGNKKGETLVAFLKQLRLKPKKILFVDNKLHHIENVGKALQEFGVDYLGRRHGKADQKIESMDKKGVEIQHRYYFGEILNNEQAKALVKLEN